VADILREHIADYQSQYPLLPHQHKIVYDLLNCRTAYLVAMWSSAIAVAHSGSPITHAVTAMLV
jgi:hypothetical protein